MPHWLVAVVILVVVGGLVALGGCSVMQGIFGSTPEQQAANEATAAKTGGSLAVTVLLENVPAENVAQVQSIVSQELSALSTALAAGNLNIGQVIQPFQAQLTGLVPAQYSALVSLGLGALAGVDVSTSAIPAQYVNLLQAFIAGAQSAVTGSPATTTKAVGPAKRDADVAQWQAWLKTRGR